MNFLYLSPHFPPNFISFVKELSRAGATVLGLGDAPYESLPWEVKNALTEYYYLNDLNNPEMARQAGRYFENKYGHIDRVDSFQEFWIPIEAALRDELGAFGKGLKEIEYIRRKSKMKEKYHQARIPTGRWALAEDYDQTRQFISQVSYPIILKPDIGVGAMSTYKISSDNELRNFFNNKPEADYIAEEFLSGELLTYDGLCDKEGNIVFEASIAYSEPIADVVNNDNHVAYFIRRRIPLILKEAGKSLVKAFDVRERFFHFEFFLDRANNKLRGLEANIRPPGVLTIDLWNFGFDMDIAHEYSQLLATGKFTFNKPQKYYACYVGRKDWISYEHSHEEVIEFCKPVLVHYQRIPDVFARAISNFAYIIRAPEFSDLVPFIDYIWAGPHYRPFPDVIL